ncbi:MAG: amidohydrolase family protein [Bacteroidota bacterium]|nr:amidohydrolase family protein [Bacteroidota bacterium]
MKILRIIIALALCNQIFAQETFPVNGVAETFKPIYAFTNANIISSPGVEFKNSTLLIQGDKILELDTNLNIPKGAIIYDLNGDYIYPSFIDLYSDYGLPKAQKGKYHYYRPQYKSNKSGAYHWNEAIHPEINSSEEFSSNNDDAKSYLSNGFGVVLTHIQDGILRGSGALVSLSKKSDNENLLIKDCAAFYSFKKGVSTQKNPTSLMGSIALIRQTFLDSEWYKSQKNQKNLSYDAFVKQQELPQIFSLNDELDYNRIYKITDEFEVDFIIKGNGKEFLRIDEVESTKFSVIIPLNFPNAYEVSNPETADWISLQKLKNWEAAPYNPALLAQNEIEFCITSADLKNSKDFLKKLRIAITKGLSKEDALAALTTTPARLVGADNIVGTLEAGMLANFIITSDDIFEKGNIYENWTLGEKHIINKKQNVDIRGHYTFNSDEFENKLITIKGELSKPKTIFHELDSAILITNLSENNLNLSTNDGSFRAIGKFINGAINGRYQNGKGEYNNFTMIRDSLFINQKKELTNDKINTSIPAIWFPNKAFGFENPPQHKNVLFKNATIWTNESEGILQNSDVIISEGKIIAIGGLLNPLDYFQEGEFEIIDASKLHLTSGIIDEHSHIAISRGVNEASQAVSSEVRIGDVINPNDHNIYRQLSGGTVASQLLHGSANPIGGQSAIIKLRWGSNAEEMKIAGADKFIKFALGENVKQSNWGDFENERFPQTRMGVEQVFYDAFYRARAYQKIWRDYINLSSSERKNTPAPREDLELNALVEILNSERFITCHSYVQSEINMLMHVADSMGFTVNIFTHILEGYKVAKKMKEHGAGASTFSDWWAYKFEVNEAIPYNATLLNNAGVITAINSDDAEMGRRLNQEAAKAVKYGGTSEEDAWKMVTLNAAKLLHLDDRMGSIKIGKDADIVLWTENPLSVYAKVLQTYIDGKLMFEVEFDKQLQERDKQERMRIIKLMMEDKNGEEKTKAEPTIEKLYHCDTEYDE